MSLLTLAREMSGLLLLSVVSFVVIVGGLTWRHLFPRGGSR